MVVSCYTSLSYWGFSICILKINPGTKLASQWLTGSKSHVSRESLMDKVHTFQEKYMDKYNNKVCRNQALWELGDVARVKLPRSSLAGSSKFSFPSKI